MVTTPTLGDLIDKFRLHQEGIGRADGTVERYRYTVLLITRLLDAEGLEATRNRPTGEPMNRFAAWLRATPANEHHGTTQRAESGIHPHLRDLRAFTRRLSKNGHLDRDLDYRCPNRLRGSRRVLNDDELQRVWNSRYLSESTPGVIRNRSSVGFMLDTGLGHEKVTKLTLDRINLERR